MASECDFKWVQAFPQVGASVSASGCKRFRKWVQAFPQVGASVSASGCKALEQWLSAVGYNFVSDFIFFEVGK